MLGNNAREFVISLPKQPKYTSEQMPLFSYLKSGFVIITNYTNYPFISCQKIFILFSSQLIYHVIFVCAQELSMRTQGAT